MASRPERRPVVVITGASSGIGRATAFAFAESGCDLVLAARREDKLNALAAELAAFGGRAVAVRCDVTSAEEVQQLANVVDEAFGWVNVLVNNAGVGLFGTIEATSEEQLAHVFGVNVFGLSRVTRAMLPLLRRAPHTQIINISSVLGHRSLPYLGVYGATKAAVNALTESLRLELKTQGVDVLLVSPGRTDTDFQRSRMHAEGFSPEQPPLKPMTATEVAKAIVHASKTRRRETLLTLPGRAMAYGNRVSPRIMDMVAERLMGPIASQKS